MMHQKLVKKVDGSMLSAQRAKSRQWLREYRGTYRNQWVALAGSELLAAADSSKELLKRIQEKRSRGKISTKVLVTVVR